MKSRVEEMEHRQIMEVLGWADKIRWLAIALLSFGFLAAMSFYPGSLVLALSAGLISFLGFLGLEIISTEIRSRGERWHLDYLERLSYKEK